MATYAVGITISQYYYVEVQADSPDEAQGKVCGYGPATLRRLGSLRGEHVDEVMVDEDELMFADN